MAVSKNPNSSVTIVQITDSHLFHETDGCLLGMPTYGSLTAVVDQLLVEQQAIHLVLATGDISQDGSTASYRRFLEQAGRIQAPLRWLAGNHDRNTTLKQISETTDALRAVYDLPAWRVVLLDSSVTGNVAGHLADEQLELLEHALRTAGERSVLIALHHHPVPIGCAWLDSLGLCNADALFAVVDHFRCVKAIVWGHVHQDFEIERNGVRLLAAPSTCVQFKPQSTAFALDEKAPGYRWFRLHADGQFATGVSRIAGDRFPVNTHAQGY